MKPTRSFFSGDSILASFVYLKSSRFIIFFTHILLACFRVLRFAGEAFRCLTLELAVWEAGVVMGRDTWKYNTRLIALYMWFINT
ncbi:hypothetical protein HanRHA438_Chr04g0173491 [Helianthus annuus]|uniref:Uncharacterized protein n=1 Tax=Helianthus annuus TaxID=4232 RepID=A0A9K3J8X7_HELAN|nr:hypothetical protein HanXRQr2_Chr04g0163691 [Helianthus annuus]KAJ0926635.1 hypothetical protein HanRHA438_Chr04g0173491 [Helianthus annuus]KAJ0931116.1 hypothetical protein HanPSC8_Chr04g0157671 [Helianthus annuus]